MTTKSKARPRPSKAVVKAIELVGTPKKPATEPVLRSKHEKLVKALKKLHPMD